MNNNSIYRCTILSLVLISRLKSVISDPYGSTQPGYPEGGFVDPNTQYYGYDQGYGGQYDPGYAYGYDQGYAGYGYGYDQSYSQPSEQAYPQQYDQAYGQLYDEAFGQSFDQAYGQSYDQAYTQGYDPSYSQFMGQGYGQQFPDPYSHQYSQSPDYFQDQGFQDFDVVDKHHYTRQHKGQAFVPAFTRGPKPTHKSQYQPEFPEEDFTSGIFDHVSIQDPYDTRSERSFTKLKSTSSSHHKQPSEHKKQPGNFRTILLDISRKKSTNSVIYDYDDKSRTHTFSAAEGVLFEGAIDENAEQVWVSEPNRYADKLTVLEKSPGVFEIKAFVPVEGTSSSDMEMEKPHLPAHRVLDKKTGRSAEQPKFQSQVVRHHDPYQEYEMAHRHRDTEHRTRRTIDIDLLNRWSTDQVHYHFNKRYFIHSFKPKAGLRIRKITKGDRVKYVHQSGPLPDEVIIIVLPDNSEVMRVLFPSAEDVASDQEYVMAPASPNLVDIDIKRFENSRGVKYTYDKNYDIHRFTCEPNHLIKKVLKQGVAVRQFPDNECPDRVLIFKIPGKGSTLRVLYPGQDEGIDGILRVLKPREPEKVEEVKPTLITVNVKDLQSTSKIEFREEPDGTRVFVCKSGYLINRIVADQAVLEAFSSNFPNKVTVSLDQYGKRVVDFSTPFKPEYITLDIRAKKDTSQFKFEMDAKGRYVYYANRPYLFYEVRKDNDLLWYSRDGRYPEKVYIIPVEGSKPILRVFYPKDMTFPKLTKIEGYRPDLYKAHEFEEPPEPPEPHETKPAKRQEPQKPMKTFEPTKVEPTTKTTKQVQDDVKSTKSTQQLPVIKVDGKIQIVDGKGRETNDKLHAAPLNLSHRKNTDSYAYYATEKLGTYKANVGYGFNLVNEKENHKIWDTTVPEEYAVEVYADGIGMFAHMSNVTLYLANKQYIHYHKHEGKTWITIPPILELDIHHKASTLQSYMFSANYNFLFNKVIDKGKVIWDSQGLRECVTVTVKEDGQTGMEVTVHLPDGVVSFRKDKTTDQWVDLDAQDGSGQKAAMTMNAMTDLEIMRAFDVGKITIITVDPNDVTKHMENDENAYDKKVDGEDHSFEFHRNNKCTEVKYDGKMFWNYDEKKHALIYPKCVKFEKKSLLIAVDFGVIALMYKFNGQVMSFSYAKKPEPIEVDMSKSEIVGQPSTTATVRSLEKDAISKEIENDIVTYTTKDQYAMNPVKYKAQVLDPKYSFIEAIGRCVKRTYENKHPVTLNIRDLFTEEEIECDDIAKKITTYTAKGNFVFKKINVNSSKIWETSSPGEYGIIVEYDKEDKNIKIYKLNGTTERHTFQVAPAEIGNLFTLNILRKITTAKYRYSRNNGSDVFTCFESFLIFRVKRGDDVLFTFEDKVYPYQVVVGPKKNGERKIECHFSLKPNNVLMIKSKTIVDNKQEQDKQSVEEEALSSKEEDEEEDGYELSEPVFQDQEEEEYKEEEVNKPREINLQDSSSDDEDSPECFDTKGLKLMGLNLSGKEAELDLSRFTLKQHVINKDILVFDFKRNVQCVRIKHKDIDVWFLDTSPLTNHDLDDDSDDVGSEISDTVESNGKRSTGTQTKRSLDDSWIHKYPVSVAYNTNELVIWIVFWTTYLEFMCLDGTWYQKVGTPSYLDTVDKKGLEIFTLTDYGNIRQNDELKFTVTESGIQTSTLVFAFREGSKCLLVKHMGKKLWSRRDDVTPLLNYEREYPSKIVYHVQAKTIFILFTNSYLGYVFMQKKWELKVNKPKAENYKQVNGPTDSPRPEPAESAETQDTEADQSTTVSADETTDDGNISKVEDCGSVEPTTYEASGSVQLRSEDNTQAEATESQETDSNASNENGSSDIKDNDTKENGEGELKENEENELKNNEQEPSGSGHRDQSKTHENESKENEQSACEDNERTVNEENVSKENEEIASEENESTPNEENQQKDIEDDTSDMMFGSIEACAQPQRTKKVVKSAGGNGEEAMPTATAQMTESIEDSNTRLSTHLWTHVDKVSDHRKLSIFWNNQMESMYYTVLDGNNGSNLTILDINDRVSTKKVEYEYDEDNDIHIYSAKDPYILDTVKKGNNVIWSHEEGPYPDTVLIFKDENNQPVVRVVFPSDVSSQRSTSVSKQTESTVPRSQRERDQIVDPIKKLILLNLKNTASTQLIHYEYDQEADTHTFTSAYPYLFGLIKKGNTVIWEPEKDNYPDTVLIFPDSPGNYTMRMLFPDKLPSTPRPLFTPEGHDLHREPSLIPKSSHERPEISNEPLPVELNIDYRWSHPKFDYSQSDNVGTYRSRQGYAFSRVTSDDKFLFFKSHSLLWQGLAYTEYARKVNLVKYEFDEMFEITLYLLSGFKKKFVKHKDLPWTAIDLSQTNPVVISVRSVYDTYSYTNTYSGKVRTLEPKPHFSFSGVRDGTDVIWHTLDPEQYSNKINVIGNKFIIHLKNGKEKVYELIDEVWTEKI
ncbi:uncharacterized protein TOT_040000863 [Theileria orientalis strain Shintoku]|uniref:Uncharacterized protein n=1 Tax=Theileria orientalis strain Shintoku TaxID=869250 RepID=J7M4T2_THEOR|nr:uncharacterized protein TOT_040000863 [Theileria orientalis strain Shintoku]BAM42495.1 uncharacterized protein TOT_040000863 [Theileria orientalis strain Shintoku]|eukprot:XP_009692796.1 uncharacterized protein TOT_040000863 [Theileria orientalis strain Shintoku]